MLFAHAVLIGNVRYEPEGESAILVTISEDVNIVVTASATEPARYVDIPMKSVQGVTLDQILSTQSQTPMYGLLITLRNEPYNCYYVNAATGNDQTIALAFMSENDAKTLKRIIQGKLPTNRKSMEVREPEGEMDVSMPLSDDELGDAPLSNSQDLRETARQATSFVARNLPNGVSQRQQVDGSDASQWAETIPSCGVEGINVSVDTHSVLRNGPPTAQHEREVRPPQEEDVGFDSSYDISPKAASQNKSSVTGRRNFTQSLQNLIGATVDSDTTAAVANNIATKLSRRLQNGEGEVEVNDAEPVSTSVGTIIAEEKSTNRKEKVTREKAPAKDRGKTHEAPKPPKKGGVGKGKKKALPDQLESVREEQAPLKSTDQRNGLIASSKRTSKSSGQNPNSLSEEAPKQNLNPLPNGSAKHTKPTEKVNADEESIWDEALIPSDQDSVKQSERTVAVKKARKQPAKAAKAKKGEQIQGHLKKAKSQPKKAPGESKKAQTKLLAKPAIKQKLSPVALSQPKLRREAARIANKRIQHVDESDEIVDDDTETVTKPNTISSAAAATQFHLLNMTDKTRKQPIRRGDENDTSLRAEKQRRKLAEDASVQRHPERALPSTKMQPARRPVSDSYEDVTSPENVELVSEPHSEKPPGVALLATSDHPTADKADRQVQVVPTDAIPDDDVAHSYHHSNASEQAFVPDSVPNMQVALLKGDEEGVMDAQAKGQYDLERTTMVGEMVDSHFQEALLYASDGLTFIGDEANPQDEIKIAPLAKEEAQPRLPVVGKGKEVRKIEQDTIFSTYTPQLPKEKGAENKAERSSEAAVTLMPKQIELRNGSKTPQFPQQRSELVKDDPYTINKPKLPGRTHVTPKVSRLKTLNPNPAVQQPHRTVNADNPIPPRQVQGSKSIATLETHANRSRREIVPPNVLAMISTSVSHQQDDTPLLEAVRRVPMISFGASGPRNQGMVSTEKSRQPKLSNAMQGHAVEEAIAHGNPTPKRRFAPYRDDPASWEHDQPAKKRKQNVETPLSRHKHVPQMLAEASPEKPQPEARRRSSQSTRVMENGSPMPLLHTRNDIPAGSEIHARYYEVSDAFRRAHLEDDDDDPIVIQDALNEPILSLPRNVSKLEIIDMRHGTFPSNRKQVPSSPHAPSTFGTVPVHHVYDDGAIVNAATKEPLVPTQPQDPFVGASQMSSGPFMKALRKSSEMEAGRQSDQANEQKTSAGFSLKKRSHALAEDLDKTLVDSPPRPKKRKMLHPISSNISSSSPSSSEEVSGSSESPSQESDGETSANWRTAYEPHQSNMLEVLTHISHVSMSQDSICLSTDVSIAPGTPFDRQRDRCQRHSQGLCDRWKQPHQWV